jgi:hypothetical protein
LYGCYYRIHAARVASHKDTPEINCTQQQLGPHSQHGVHARLVLHYAGISAAIDEGKMRWHRNSQRLGGLAGKRKWKRKRKRKKISQRKGYSKRD